MDYTDCRIAIALCAALIVLAVGCRNDEPKVEVRVCGDAEIPRDVDTLRVSLLGADRQTRRTAVIELLECPEGEIEPLPQSVSFRPFGGEAWAAVQGLADGRPELRYERRLDLSADASTSVKLAVNRDCIGISCPTGQTCIGGACTLAPRPGASPTRCESASDDGTVADTGMGRDADESSPGDAGADASESKPGDAGADANGSSSDDVGTNGTRDTSSEESAALCPGADRRTPDETDDAANSMGVGGD